MEDGDSKYLNSGINRERREGESGLMVLRREGKWGNKQKANNMDAHVSCWTLNEQTVKEKQWISESLQYHCWHLSCVFSKPQCKTDWSSNWFCIIGFVCVQSPGMISRWPTCLTMWCSSVPVVPTLNCSQQVLD